MKQNSFLVFLESYEWIFIIIMFFFILFSYRYRYNFEKVITVKKLDYTKDRRYNEITIITDSDNNLYSVRNSSKLSKQFYVNQKYKIKGYDSIIQILGRYKNIIGAERI